MACGPGKGLLQLQKLAAQAQEGVDNVKDAVEGFADDLNGAAAAMDEKLSKLIEGAKGMLPEIDLPDFGDFTLPDLKLPELNLPEISLQLEVTTILSKLTSSNPDIKAQALKSLETLGDKFPDLPAAEIEQLKADLLSGKITPDNLCKKVKDLVKKDGKFEEKGVPITAPEEASKDETEDIEMPKIEEKTKEAEELPESKEQGNVRTLLGNLSEISDQINKDEIKDQLKSLVPKIKLD